MKNVPDKSMENQNAQSMFKNFFPEDLAVYWFVQAWLTVTVSIQGFFLRRGVVSTSPNPKLEDHVLSAVRDCLFNIFAATLHTGDRSSIRNLRTRQAVVTGTHLWDNVKHVAQPNRLHVTVKRSAEKIRFSCRIPTARIDTLLIFSTYCFRTD
jgi:hypothetical protein